MIQIQSDQDQQHLLYNLFHVGYLKFYVTHPRLYYLRKGPGKRMNIDGSNIFFLWRALSFSSFYLPGLLKWEQV